MSQCDIMQCDLGSLVVKRSFLVHLYPIQAQMCHLEGQEALIIQDKFDVKEKL